MFISAFQFVKKTAAQSILTRISKLRKQFYITMTSCPKPCVLFVLGAPGSGKGTQCAKIVEKYKFSHLSAGELLRMERDSPDSQLRSLIDNHIRNGTIVPVEITCKLLERAVLASDYNHFLIDGFPRNQNNMDGWQREMTDKVNLLGVLFFDCDEDVAMKRCLSRGASGSGRTDDNEESLRKRFITYKNDTMPIIDYYRDRNLVHIVDANGSPGEVFEEVDKVLSNLVPKEIKK